MQPKTTKDEGAVKPIEIEIGIEELEERIAPGVAGSKPGGPGTIPR
jgi:hypothetical protein